MLKNNHELCQYDYELCMTQACTVSAYLECGSNIIAGVLVAIVCLYTQSLRVVEKHMQNTH